MPRYQKKPTIADVAARRNQTVAQLIAEWAVKSYEDLLKRCKREGVSVPEDLALSFIKESDATLTVKATVTDGVKNALVDLSKKPAPKSDVKSDKKPAKGKVTLDEPAASDKRNGVDPDAPAGPEDPA